MEKLGAPGPHDVKFFKFLVRTVLGTAMYKSLAPFSKIFSRMAKLSSDLDTPLSRAVIEMASFGDDENKEIGSNLSIGDHKKLFFSPLGKDFQQNRLGVQIQSLKKSRSCPMEARIARAQNLKKFADKAGTEDQVIDISFFLTVCAPIKVVNKLVFLVEKAGRWELLAEWFDKNELMQHQKYLVADCVEWEVTCSLKI